MAKFDHALLCFFKESLTPMNLVSGMSSDDTQQLHTSNQQHPATFAIVPGQPVSSSHYDVSHHLQFNSTNGVR